jgi:hypothetical protein
VLSLLRSFHDLLLPTPLGTIVQQIKLVAYLCFSVLGVQEAAGCFNKSRGNKDIAAAWLTIVHQLSDRASMD